ncbi:MAG: DUF3078 domain-containing protein [Mangrovibacterium sp.]
MKKIFRFLFSVILLASFASESLAQLNIAPKDSIGESVENINRYLRQYSEWYPQNYEVALKMRSLVHYLKDQRVDTILKSLDDYQTSSNRYFFRTIDNMSDSLNAPGFISYQTILEEQAKIDRNVRDNFKINSIKVPQDLIEQAQLNVELLMPSEASKLIGTKYVTLPDSLQDLDEQMKQLNLLAVDLKQLQQKDSVRNVILEQARQEYNAEQLAQVKDSVEIAYRESVVSVYSQGEQRKYANQVASKNQKALSRYNDQVMKQVNDSIDMSLRILLDHVNQEQLSLWIYNSMEDSTEVLLSNSSPYTSRFYIKNEQRDSLGVRVFSKDRNTMMMFIDDGVALNRFQERKHREVDLGRSPRISNSLTAIEKRYEIITPWKYGAVFNLGLNQTYLNDYWVKGGETSLSTLLTFKGHANYALDKITWNNTLDMRSGWINPSGSGIEKNEDKFEFVSNFGLNAVKNWYYSGEVDLETQLFNSYNYPDRDNPKSGFLAPLKTLFKLGMDYKDSNFKGGNLSLFISPITMKTVSVRDTSTYNQTTFGVDADKKSYKDLGFNIDVKYSRKLMENLNVQTKYKMFMDYENMFQAYDIDWENTFNFKINEFMTTQVILHLLYDDNVTFDTGKVDAEGNAIKKAKWQFKEFISLGFTYSLDKGYKKRREIKR